MPIEQENSLQAGGCADYFPRPLQVKQDFTDARLIGFGAGPRWRLDRLSGPSPKPYEAL